MRSVTQASQLEVCAAVADPASMRRRVFLPAVVALWGVAVVVYRFTASAASHTNGAYHSGQNGAVVFGLLMAVVGTIYVIRALRDRG